MKCPKCGRRSPFAAPLACARCYVKAHPNVPNLQQGLGFLQYSDGVFTEALPTSFALEPWAKQWAGPNGFVVEGIPFVEFKKKEPVLMHMYGPDFEPPKNWWTKPKRAPTPEQLELQAIGERFDAAVAGVERAARSLRYLARMAYPACWAN